jgi:hypothetical protein
MEHHMRRVSQLSVLCLAAGVVTACKLDQVVPTETPPTAGIRFVNAVPDTGAVDFRAVDIVENSAFYSVAFRGTALLYYKDAQAGSRHFKIFMANTDLSLPADQQQAIASTVLKDTTVTLEAGKNYTFILWGYARGTSPAMRLSIIEDNPADPGAQIALRVINAAAGLGALDVKEYPFLGTPPAAPTWAAVAELSASSYINAPAGDSVKYNVTPAGGGTALFTDAKALVGLPSTGDLEATPGTRMAGSAVTGIVVPRSVAGSKAASFTTPGIIFVWDRRPAQGCSIKC